MEKPNKTYKNVFLPPEMTAVRFLVNQIRLRNFWDLDNLFKSLFYTSDANMRDKNWNLKTYKQ